MGTELIETVSNTNKKIIKFPKIDGVHQQILYESTKKNSGEAVAMSTYKNGVQAIRYLADPNENERIKVLCLGKVQSGKTSFFINTIALAFDNGYRIAYLLAGVTTKLKDQNGERVTSDFSNDENVVVYQINKAKKEDVENDLSAGRCVVFIVLKNAAKKTNLGKMLEFEKSFKGIPSLIVDDEGDEVSPGAPHAKKKGGKAGKTHDRIVDVIVELDCCTFLSVTATPQANILLSTMDDLSPDFVSLVEPGVGYTGGNSFHDLMSNEHVIEIDDFEDFEDSIPESFVKCLHFFIFACCLKNDSKQYSMMVHPSALTLVHEIVTIKIESYINQIRKNLSDPKNVAYEASLNRIEEAYTDYKVTNPDLSTSFEQIVNRIPDVLRNISVYTFNSTKVGRIDMEREAKDQNLYKIYVGGTILGRGLTIKNLIVTYIYRTSKTSTVDTMYQRARWLGYKIKYFDVCRVYMTKELKKQFIAIVDNENDMWQSIKSFLLSNISFKSFPRIFVLDYEDPNFKLLLTRKTVSDTVVLERLHPGFSYYKSIRFKNDERAMNRHLFEKFYDKWKSFGEMQRFGPSETHNHNVIQMKFSEFYTDFLSDFKFPQGCDFGPNSFRRILNEVENKKRVDNIFVVVMRPNVREQRSTNPSKSEVLELLQGRSHDGITYVGDKSIMSDTFHMQIHLVYQDDYDDYVPMITLNDPITVSQIKYVTGDNYYGETV